MAAAAGRCTGGATLSSVPAELARVHARPRLRPSSSPTPTRARQAPTLLFLGAHPLRPVAEESSRSTDGSARAGRVAGTADGGGWCVVEEDKGERGAGNLLIY